MECKTKYVHITPQEYMSENNGNDIVVLGQTALFKYSYNNLTTFIGTYF